MTAAVLPADYAPLAVFKAEDQMADDAALFGRFWIVAGRGRHAAFDPARSLRRPHAIRQSYPGARQAWAHVTDLVAVVALVWLVGGALIEVLS